MFDWNDLRYFLTVAREGSTLAAGRALRLSANRFHFFEHFELVNDELCAGTKIVGILENRSLMIYV